MALEHVFTDASSVMTVISFVTFIGILTWTFVIKRSADFDDAARLPFADEHADIFDSAENFDSTKPTNTEKHHG